MEPGPRAANLESYNPLDAKFTMKKASLKSMGKTEHFCYMQQFVKQKVHQITFEALNTG